MEVTGTGYEGMDRKTAQTLEVLLTLKTQGKQHEVLTDADRALLKGMRFDPDAFRAFEWARTSTADAMLRRKGSKGSRTDHYGPRPEADPKKATAGVSKATKRTDKCCARVDGHLQPARARKQPENGGKHKKTQKT